MPKVPTGSCITDALRVMKTEGRLRTFYELLGVDRKATKDQIRDAYKELARIYHPDSHFFDEIVPDAGPSHEQVDVFKEITDAYNTLSNETKRAEYDQSLPKDLPEWDAPGKDHWHTEHRVNRVEAENHYDQKSQPYNWGSFGRVEPITKSAFDDERIYHVTTVSEMIQAKRGIWARIRWLLTGK